MGLLDGAKRLDDAVLGRSGSTRGFAFNVLGGLHPALTTVWFVASGACLLAAAIALVGGRLGVAVTALVVAGTCALMGFVARSVPAAPTRSVTSHACSWCESGRHEMCTGQAMSPVPEIGAGWGRRGIGSCSCSAAGHGAGSR